MVQVGRLLEINSHYAQQHAFEECVGDRYLYAKNAIYRKIRDHALLCGVSYCREGSPLWHDYQVCPLFCLNTMLEKKNVPIIDNKSSLERVIERAGPAFAISGKFLTKVLKRNYLLHESSHYIAHHFINSMTKPAHGPLLASEDQYSIAAALLGEAFAAVTERLAWALADNPTHVLLFNLNSYMDHREPNHQLLLNSLQKFGEPVVARLGMIALFLNNLKKRPITDEEFKMILVHFFPQLQDVEASESLRALVDQIFSITPAFLEETTPAYFRMLGREEAFVTLSSRNYSAQELEALMLSPIAWQLLDIVGSATDRVLIQMAS